jgi:hypothetical protein
MSVLRFHSHVRACERVREDESLTANNCVLIFSCKTSIFLD